MVARLTTLYAVCCRVMRADRSSVLTSLEGSLYVVSPEPYLMTANQE